MIELKLYQPGDAFKVVPHLYYEDSSQDQIDMLAKDPSSVFLTFWDGVKAIGVSGIMPQASHSAEVVMLISEELQKSPKFLHKTVKQELHRLVEGLKLRRVQATVKSDFLVGKCWLQRLGFEQEGILRRFGANDQDYTIWSYLP